MDRNACHFTYLPFRPKALPERVFADPAGHGVYGDEQNQVHNGIKEADGRGKTVLRADQPRLVHIGGDDLAD